MVAELIVKRAETFLNVARAAAEGVFSRADVQLSVVRTEGTTPYIIFTYPPNTLFFAVDEAVYFLDGGIACQVL